MPRFVPQLLVGAGAAAIVWGALSLPGRGPQDQPDSSSESSAELARTRDNLALGRWLTKPAPRTPFETLDGSLARLADHTGTTVVLNFWGTWCAPCRREIPELIELYEEYGDRGVIVVGVAIESGSADAIKAFADELGINYPIWIGSAEAAVEEFGTIGYPFTVLIDPRGIIRKEYLGPQSRETLAQALTDLAALEPS